LGNNVLNVESDSIDLFSVNDDFFNFASSIEMYKNQMQSPGLINYIACPTAPGPALLSNFRTNCGPQVKKFAHPWYSDSRIKINKKKNSMLMVIMNMSASATVSQISNITCQTHLFFFFTDTI